MNKKFSTLVAGLLLASSAGTYAQVITPNAGAITAAIDVVKTSDIKSDVDFAVVAAQTSTNPKGGYVKGQAYILGDPASSALKVETSADGVNTLIYGPVTIDLTGVNRALWVLQSLEAPAGTFAPKYVFMNKATNVILSLDQTKAINYDDKGDATILANTSSVLTGEMDWLSAPSYKDPAKEDNALYVAASNDNVLALVAKTNGSVYLAKMTKAQLADATTNADIIRVKPYTVDGTKGVFTLSPNELNTMLGINGTKATKDSYFQFSFNPAATVKGGDNLFGVDLQAVAVDQFEQKYGTDKELMVTPASDGAFYASLYPLAASGYEADKVTPKKYSKYSDRLNPDKITAFKETRAQWVALKNRDGKYLVVDTISVSGTSQGENLRLSFNFDDLYNTSKPSRFRDPRSFLFKVDYNPTSGNVEIVSNGYLSAAQGTAIKSAFDQANYNSKDFKTPALAVKSTWYTDANTNNVTTDLDQNYIIKASLGTTTEVTLGNKAKDNQFAIKLGASGLYQPTSKVNRAYLLQVVGSSDAKKIGKYWIDNLYGTFEVMEQAQRQNFQDMPAAQWVLTSTSSLAGAPVTIKNREFGNAPSSTTPSTGILYGVAGQSKQAFFMGGDTLQFIEVEKQGVAELGYKYLTDKELLETVYTFNYLHELAMDKPINTVNDTDSLVWVDKEGNAMKFQLERVIDDTYGYNGNLSAVKQLNRSVYYIKVNDASKLQNDRRYLTYDTTVKKYVVSNLTPDIKNGKANDEINPTAFFLKENNEVEGAECYYTLVTTDLQRVLTALDDHDAKYMVKDEGLNGTVSASWGDYKDELTGQTKTGWYVSNLGNKTFEELAALTTTANSSYGANKVSVDNNTLNLVNGDLNDGTNTEVANSAFAVVKDENPLYRRFNTAFEGIASDAPDTVKFFRVNATDKEYLYEDANSIYSKDKGFNFLGVEGKGDSKKAAMYVDTAYVKRGTVMPQYLIALNPTVVEEKITLCEECGLLDCEHTKKRYHSVTARFLVNLQDSVDFNKGAAKAKYQWNNNYTRLGFVDATHIGDSLIIKNSIFTGDKRPMVVGKPDTYASKDTINLSGNKHNNAVFEFRLFKTGSNDFLIESESATGIAPEKGGWVKIQNGVPVIAKYNTYKEAGLDAEIFNVEAANGERPTENDAIDANTVSVVAGNGSVTIYNAEGKTVAISNILGQSIANTVISSDNASITVPAGIVVVSIEGEDAAKVIVK